MKKHPIFILARDIAYKLFTITARVLPPLVRSKAIAASPTTLSLPVTLPVNVQNLPSCFAAKFIASKVIPSRQIFLLKNVYVNGHGVVFKNLRIFLPSLPWLRDLNLHRNGRSLSRQWLGDIHYVPDTEIVALVFDQWSAENYYHWMVESLPRLLLIKTKYPECLVIIPEPSPSFIKETAGILGFKKFLPIKRSDFDIMKIPHLAFPEKVYWFETKEYREMLQRNTGEKMEFLKNKFLIERPKEELLIQIRKMILGKIGIEPTIPIRKIYVSRSRQKTRRLMNEKETLPLLKQHGFETVFFEGLTFIEQVKTMQETAILLGVHGANMVNILFMQKGTKVIELMNKNFFNEAYYLISSTVQLPYFSVPCKMANSAIKLTDDSVLLNDADLIVDTDQLEKVLNMSDKSSFSS